MRGTQLATCLLAVVGLLPHVAAQTPESADRECVLDAEAAVRAEDPEQVAVTIHGALVDVRGEALPESGVSVRLTIGKRRLEQRVDADGRFAFALEEKPTSATFWVDLAASGWRWFDHHAGWAEPLTEEQLDGRAPIEVRIARRVRGPVTGVAVDATTGDPLPFHRFTLSSSLRSKAFAFEPVDVQADAEGRFQVASDVCGGMISVRSPHGEPTTRRGYWDCLVQTDDYREPAVLRLESGPTFHLDLHGTDLPQDIALRAWLVPEHEKFNRMGSEVRVDAETGRPWVRFASNEWIEQRDGFLAISDEAGTWTGIAHFAAAGLAATQELEVHLERTAALKPVVERPMPESAKDKSYYPIGLQRELVPLGGFVPDAATKWRISRSASLVPGRYLYREWSRVHQESKWEVTLGAGEVATPTWTLALLPEARTVRGEVRMEDGSALPNFRLYLQSMQGPSRLYEVHFYAEPIFCGTGIDYWASKVDGSNGARATFEIADVPSGGLEAFVGVFGDLVAELSREVDESGDLNYSIVLTDSRSGAGFGVRPDFSALGPRRSTTRPRVQVQTRVVETGAWLPPRTCFGGVFDRRDPAQLGHEWAIYVRGCKPIYLTAEDFVADALGRAVVPVRLERGFGARLTVSDSSGSVVEGAEVLVDGAWHGVTDSAGHYELILDEPPESVEVRTATSIWKLPRPTMTANAPRAWYEVRLL